MDAVERIAKSAFAEPGHPTQRGNAHRRIEVRAKVSFHLIHGLAARSLRGDLLGNRSRIAIHAEYTTTRVHAGKLTDVTGWAGKTDRRAPNLY